MSWEPSVEPLSAMMISPTMPVRSRKAWALPIHRASVSASFRQGIRMVSSIASANVSPSAPLQPCAVNRGQVTMGRLAAASLEAGAGSQAREDRVELAPALARIAGGARDDQAGLAAQ